VWSDLRALPLDAQVNALRDPARRERLVHIANTIEEDLTRFESTAIARRPASWDNYYVLDHVDGTPNRSIGSLARERRADPVAVLLDVAIEKNLRQFFLHQVVTASADELLADLRHPNSVCTFSDAGAHASQVFDTSMPSRLISEWVRIRGALTIEEAVRKLSFDMAMAWGLPDRGLLRVGQRADVVTFDADLVAPDMPEVRSDLPGGATRLYAKGRGWHSTVVNGRLFIDEGELTGELAGEVLVG
jgi:N-acyl-D-aspartate/D-glutamate deacylase